MRINKTITVGAAPINVFTGTIAAESSRIALATRVFIEMIAGGTGLGYVMDGITGGRVPSKSVSTDVTAQLAPASSTAPGGTYSDASPAGIDVNAMWVDGATTSDTIKVSYDLKV